MSAPKRKPSGYVARCRCGVITGAIDLERSDRTEVSKIRGQWVGDGLTLEPRFGAWSEIVEGCKCEQGGGS